VYKGFNRLSVKGHHPFSCPIPCLVETTDFVNCVCMCKERTKDAQNYFHRRSTVQFQSCILHVQENSLLKIETSFLEYEFNCVELELSHHHRRILFLTNCRSIVVLLYFFSSYCNSKLFVCIIV